MPSFREFLFYVFVYYVVILTGPEVFGHFVVPIAKFLFQVCLKSAGTPVEYRTAETLFAFVLLYRFCCAVFLFDLNGLIRLLRRLFRPSLQRFCIGWLDNQLIAKRPDPVCIFPYSIFATVSFPPLLFPYKALQPAVMLRLFHLAACTFLIGAVGIESLRVRFPAGRAHLALALPDQFLTRLCGFAAALCRIFKENHILADNGKAL